MDVDRHEVQVNGHAVDLTPKEFQILQHFLESPRRVFSRQEMLNRVWGEGYALEEHALDVHIHSLRQKIEVNPANPTFLLTVRGVGYKLQA
jgi:two-component system, OmpR family, response regulator RegX3